MKKQTYMPNTNFSDTLRDAFHRLRPRTNQSIEDRVHWSNIEKYATIGSFSSGDISFSLQVVKFEFGFSDSLYFNNKDIYYLDVNSGILSPIPGYTHGSDFYSSYTRMSIVTVCLRYYKLIGTLGYSQILEAYEDYISSNPGVEETIIETIKECVNLNKNELTFSNREPRRYIKTRGVTGKVLGKYVAKNCPASSYSDSAIPIDSHLKTYTSYSGYIDDLDYALYTKFGYLDTKVFHSFSFRFGYNENNNYLPNEYPFTSIIGGIKNIIPNSDITYLSPISGKFFPTSDNLRDFYLNPIASNTITTNVFNDNVVRYKDGSFPLWFCIATNM